MQKLVELEGKEGTEIKAEEKPEGEKMLDSSMDALRPPYIDIIFFSNKFFSLFRCIWQQPP